MAMRTVCSIFLLGCAAASLVSAQVPDGAGSAVVRALEREWAEAQSHNNNGALDLILDNAVVYVEYGRLVPKGDYLSRIRQQHDAPADAIVVEPISVRSFGNTAIVTGSYREAQRKDGRRTVRRWRFVDTWCFKTRGWVLIAAGSSPIEE